MMRHVVVAVLVLGVLVAALALAANLASAGVHGLIVVACGLLPALLAATARIRAASFPRWASGLSLAAFLIAGMKTSAADSLSRIMMAAFVGMLVSLALLVKPYRAEQGT